MDHLSAAENTPLRSDAFDLSDEAKIENIKGHVTAILNTLGLDLTDDSLKGTPNRVAKMFVNEYLVACLQTKDQKPLLLVINTSMEKCLLKKILPSTLLASTICFPIVGKAHVAYISKGTVVGLSKMNRIVDYFAKRPQVQERLTIQLSGNYKKYSAHKMWLAS